MALFNPAVVLAPAEGSRQCNEERVTSLKERMGVEPKLLSPYHQVKAGAPPTIVFHGKADTTVPYVTVELFTKAMTDAGNKCTLSAMKAKRTAFSIMAGAATSITRRPSRRWTSSWRGSAI